MTRVEAVAEAHGLTVEEVGRWPGRLVAVFYRNAERRGWLIQGGTTE